MDKSREEQIAAILNLEVMNLKSDTWYVLPWGQMAKNRELLEELKSPEGQLTVRQRINELLDELNLVRKTWRCSKAIRKKNNSLEICNLAPPRETVYGIWCSDTELPEMKQNLLLWLAERLAERKGK